MYSYGLPPESAAGVLREKQEQEQEQVRWMAGNGVGLQKNERFGETTWFLKKLL